RYFMTYCDMIPLHLTSDRCNSKEERNKHVFSNHVRWTELLRLPYFNLIRHCVIYPMHNLFLGIAHWIVKRLWIDGGKISKEQLEIMQIEQITSRCQPI